MAYRLTELQAAFARELIKGKSATQAAKDAGYSENYANRQALTLIDKPQIQEYLQELRAEVEKVDVADAQEVLQGLTAVLRGEGTRPTSTKAGIVDLPPSWGDSVRAMDLLGKYHTLFADRVENSGTVNINVRRIPADGN